MTEETNRAMKAEPDVEDVEVDDGSNLFTDEADTDAEDEGEDLEKDAEGDEDEDDLEDDEPEEDDLEEEPDKKPEGKGKPAGKDAPKLLTVKHLDKDVEVDPYSQEGIALIQKGMDYDHVKASLSELKGSIEEAAKAAGMATDDFLKSIVESTKAALVEAAIAEIKKKYPDAPDELVKEHAEKQAEEKASKLKLEAAATAESDKAKAWAELKKAYPSVSTEDKLPQAVRDAIAAGTPPIVAMMAHEIRELKAKEKAAEQNKKNQDRSTGSAKSSGGTKKKDPFLDGAGM